MFFKDASNLGVKLFNLSSILKERATLRVVEV